MHRIDERHVRFATDEAVGQLLAQLLDVGQAATHQALDRQHGVQRIAGGSVTRCLPDFAAASFEVTHRRRQNHITLRIGQGLAHAAAQCSDQGIGGAQVDPYRQAALMGLGRLTGFGNLQ